MEPTFSNPRLEATFTDWPLGGNKRGNCTFKVEQHPTRGYRVSRQTFSKPKYHTYGGKAAIVDGSDGRTYIIQRTNFGGFIRISGSDFMNGPNGGSIFKDHADFAYVDGLISEANAKDPSQSAA